MSPIDVRRAALSLSPEDRASLARDLIASLDAPSDADAGAAWLAVIESRAAEVTAGTTRLVDWPDARARILARLAERRASAPPR